MIGLYIISVSFCFVWSLALIYMQRSLAAMPVLHDEVRNIPCENLQWPTLSIVIPACNEADHIEAALSTLLAQDYPRLEVVVIDDRSSDTTGEIIDRLAENDERIRAVHVKSLPEGWLGKVHALNEGVLHAHGDWFLFTDADVYFEPGVLRAALCYAMHHRLEHLTCLPETRSSTHFWLNVSIYSFFFLFCSSARLAEVNRENSKRAVGIGAFNLVEASAFARTPGLEWLRMDPADDLGLGLMLKEAGARARLLNATGEMSVPWYEDLGMMVRGLEKNSFGPGSSYSYVRQLMIVLLLWGLVAAPPLSLVSGIILGDSILLGAGTLAFASSLVIAFAMQLKSVQDRLAYLFLPAGVVIVSLIMLRAAYRCLRNDGIDWRGTHYSLAQLRAGQRVRF